MLTDYHLQALQSASGFPSPSLPMWLAISVVSQFMLGL
jgi:hypothetical protein